MFCGDGGVCVYGRSFGDGDDDDDFHYFLSSVSDLIIASKFCLKSPNHNIHKEKAKNAFKLCMLECQKRRWI